MSVQVVLVLVVIGGVAVHRMAVTENAKRPAGRGATAKLTAVAAIAELIHLFSIKCSRHSKTFINHCCKFKPLLMI